mmetsp:Transcript_16118/g.34879  ORF Transcript_16118/g.34879 Transcript_16118/m.34879 type:complete len:218 (+) Transcript_16118:150-803(+)
MGCGSSVTAPTNLRADRRDVEKSGVKAAARTGSNDIVAKEQVVKQALSEVKFQLLLDRLFKKIDQDRDGNVSAEELHAFMVELCAKIGAPAPDKSEALEVLKELDRDRDHRLNKEELSSFLRQVFSGQLQLPPRSLSYSSFEQLTQRVFTHVDQDRNGSIDSSELHDFISALCVEMGVPPPSQAEALGVFHDLDSNKDGTLSKEELNLYIKQIFKLQ